LPLRLRQPLKRLVFLFADPRPYGSDPEIGLHATTDNSNDIDAPELLKFLFKNQQVNRRQPWNVHVRAFMRGFLQGFVFAFFTLTRVNARLTCVNHVMGDVSPPHPMRSMAETLNPKIRCPDTQKFTRGRGKLHGPQMDFAARMSSPNWSHNGLNSSVFDVVLRRNPGLSTS